MKRIADLAAVLRPGLRVYAPGTTGESRRIVEGLRARPEAAAGVTFTGVWLPGINRVDYAGLAPDARAEAFFFTPEARASLAAGKVSLRPLSYFETYRHLRDRAHIDVALLQVSPPDRFGRVSLGVANDFTPAVLRKARVKVAHVNPSMPRTFGSATLALADLDAVIEGDGPLLGEDAVDDPEWAAIGARIAPLVPDGATIETGIGRVPNVLPALSGHRRLKVRSGAIMTPLLALEAAGALSRAREAIVAGVAIGSRALYAFVADNPRVRFAPVGETHDVGALRATHRFVAINGVIEVDLWGQANAEFAGGRAVSSAGGIGDFTRGARLSPGGLAIAALPSATRGGTVSRIVPTLSGGVASLTRADADVVATEHGVADLRSADLDARAEALIAIAAPQFRDDLSNAWDQMRRAM